MAGPGPGEWQESAERAAAELQNALGWIGPVVLNPDKDYVRDWLGNALDNIVHAQHALEHAIQQITVART